MNFRTAKNNIRAKELFERASQKSYGIIISKIYRGISLSRPRFANPEAGSGPKAEGVLTNNQRRRRASCPCCLWGGFNKNRRQIALLVKMQCLRENILSLSIQGCRRVLKALDTLIRRKVSLCRRILDFCRRYLWPVWLVEQRTLIPSGYLASPMVSMRS